MNSQPKLQTITEVVVVAATTGETTTEEEGAGVVMATEIAMVRQSCYIELLILKNRVGTTVMRGVAHFQEK